jgi:RNA polymerase sigma-70 factor, ECF subfamily
MPASSARASAKARPRSEPASEHPDLAVTGSVNSAARRASNRRAREAESERDHELIRRVQNGDDRAFRELVDRHRRRAFAIAIGLVRDEQDALDIVQEAFVRVYRGIDAFSGAASFFTWLYRIVKNLSIDLMRRPGFQRDLAAELGAGHENFLLGCPEPDPLDAVRRKEIANALGQALDGLPAYHRGVILMREVEGLSYEEMATVMGVSKGTIMSRLFHARKKLQRALSECYAEEAEREPVELDVDGSADEGR